MKIPASMTRNAPRSLYFSSEWATNGHWMIPTFALTFGEKSLEALRMVTNVHVDIGGHTHTGDDAQMPRFDLVIPKDMETRPNHGELRLRALPLVWAEKDSDAALLVDGRGKLFAIARDYCELFEGWTFWADPSADDPEGRAIVASSGDLRALIMPVRPPAPDSAFVDELRALCFAVGVDLEPAHA